jgi:hypothetical protein
MIAARWRMRESAKEMVVDGSLVSVFKEIINEYPPSPELATVGVYS